MAEHRNRDVSRRRLRCVVECLPDNFPSVIDVVGVKQEGRHIATKEIIQVGHGAQVAGASGNVESQNYFGWDLSPDGTKLAICKSRNGPIQILSLDGRVLQEIESAELQNMRSLDWAADGQGFYIANSAQQRVDLDYVDLNARARRIWSQQGSKGTFARESPDGQHLALLGFTADTNVWSLEDF